MSERIDLGDEEFPFAIVVSDDLADTQKRWDATEETWLGNMDAKLRTPFGITDGGLYEAGFRYAGRIIGDGPTVVPHDPDTPTSQPK